MKNFILNMLELFIVFYVRIVVPIVAIVLPLVLAICLSPWWLLLYFATFPALVVVAIFGYKDIS